MSYLRKSVSILLVFMMIVSLFTIVPITASAASGDRVQLFARKWIKADVVEGKYYKLDDLYANFILFRTDPNQTFDNTFESTAIWNKTGDLALSNGHNKITVNTFDDSNLGAYWGNDDSREGIYLSDELNSAAADWYVYTWEVFNGTLTEAQAAACTDKGNVEYYTAGDRYFVPVYNEGGEKVYDGDSLTVTQVPQEQTEIPAAGHSLTHHEANAATLDAAGNSEYWECSVCGKFFSDENGETEIAPGSWVLAATGVAEVNGVKYETLQAALDAAAEGATVKLLSDIKVTSAVTVSKKVTLDLNGGSIINVGVTNRAYEKNQKK